MKRRQIIFAATVFGASLVVGAGTNLASAKTTHIKSKYGDVTVTTDSKGTVVKDSAGNIGYASGGSTDADHDRAVKDWSDR